VFLNPDTGLEPEKPSFEHVLESEFSVIWRALDTGDVLVFYQHQTNRNGQPWIHPKKLQFESAIGLASGGDGQTDRARRRRGNEGEQSSSSTQPRAVGSSVESRPEAPPAKSHQATVKAKTSGLG
jgi:hypothetical protein